MANSSYLAYLPPVLWIPDNDPAQFLGRHLRIYEKILTGLSADGFVVRAAAPFVSAQNNTIVMANASDIAQFRLGDWITIQGTPERRLIDHFIGGTIFLDGNLIASYTGGTVRIADLASGQTTFRVDNADKLEPGRPLRILQAGHTEDVIVAQVADPFITLLFGLTATYTLNVDGVPVKLLDPITVDHAGHSYADFESRIDRLFDLFNPWRTRPDFLPWLASWVALTLSDDWSEYQQRKLISQMVGIYQERGLKEGLYIYLDIYAVTAARPRIVIDDGEAIFHAVFAEDGTAVLHALAHSNTVSPVSNASKTVTVLLHPSGIAVDGNNEYFVCDPAATSLTVPRPPALWKVSLSGEVDYGPAGALPIPMPKPIFSGNPLVEPQAVTVDATNRCAVVDVGTVQSATSKNAAIYRFAPPNYPIATVIDQSTSPAFPAVHPVDMTLDTKNNFVVLDRGQHPLGNPPAGKSNPQIVVVSEAPLSAAVHPLPSVREPTALIMDAQGRFIVADAQNQSTVTPADLVIVDPTAGWSAASLLGSLPPNQNPLVFPTGLAWESSNVLLVCDVGLRWGFPAGDQSSNRVMAEQPHLYRVELSQNPPLIQRVTIQRQLVHPTKMAWDKNRRLLVTDRGESMNNPPQRDWRAGSYEFGLVVFFSAQRPTAVADRNKFRRDIAQIIENEKPGHTSWWMDFRVEKPKLIKGTKKWLTR